MNRYVSIDKRTLDLLNTISKNDYLIDNEKTASILKVGGIQIAMASTILRFKNPTIYQILDQRVYRFIYGELLSERLKEIKKT